jgi:hypothetical protein
MKNALMCLAVFLCSVLMGGFLYSSTTQALALGTVDISVKSVSAASLLTSTSSAVGQIVFCYDCQAGGSTGTICISTQATTVGGFIMTTGTICK